MCFSCIFLRGISKGAKNCDTNCDGVFFFDKLFTMNLLQVRLHFFFFPTEYYFQFYSFIYVFIYLFHVFVPFLFIIIIHFYWFMPYNPLPHTHTHTRFFFKLLNCFPFYLFILFKYKKNCLHFSFLSLSIISLALIVRKNVIQFN